MQPPKSALGAAAIGLGVLAAGTFAGAYIGSRVLPVGKRFGAMQGGYVGAIAISTGAVLFGFVDPDWANVTNTTALTGLTAFLVANLASVAQTNKSFASLDDIMPGLTAAAAGEPPTLPAASGAPASTTPAPQVITLGTDNAGQTITCHVGDTIVLSLPVSSGFGWFYAPQTATTLTYGGRNVSTTSATGTSTIADTWTASTTGTYALSLQALPIDQNGQPTSTAPQSTLTYNITVS